MVRNDRFLEDLKDRIDIVEVIRKYAELKKSGKNFMCRSPFRNERTPSFSVSPDKQFWYDFGISEGGDVVSFLEKVENVSFIEAVEMLAQMAGVEVPSHWGDDDGTKKEQKQDLYTLHAKAQEYFVAELGKSDTAKQYLASRGMKDPMIESWGLGYGGEADDGLTQYLLKNGFSQALIEQSGVAFEREFGDKKMKDRFARRVILPIREPKQGQIVAFSGRDISGKERAKYINSPENPVYHKSSTLLGFDRARKMLSDFGYIICVEGNFDVLFAHECGFTNTVATCGTALTEDHIRIIKRQVRDIVLAFDSDTAGKKALLRATELCLKLECNPFVVEVPDAKDIAELAQQGHAAVKEPIEARQPALHFLLEKFAAKNLGQGIEGEKRFLDAFFYFLRLCPRPIEVDEYLTRIAQKLHRPKDIIASEFQRYIAAQRSESPIKPKASETTAGKKIPLDASLIGLIGAYRKELSHVNFEEIKIYLSEDVRDIFEKIQTPDQLSNEQLLTLRSWEMSQENMYDDPSRALLEKEYYYLLKRLKDSHKRAQNLEAAQKLRSSFTERASD